MLKAYHEMQGRQPTTAKPIDGADLAERIEIERRMERLDGVRVKVEVVAPEIDPAAWHGSFSQWGGGRRPKGWRLAAMRVGK